MMYKRAAERTILKLSKSYPVVAVTGPRQSGKTTLTRSIFKNKKYVSLEDIDQRDFAKKDPKAFLNQSKKGLLIDEIQHIPELFSYIQGIVDQNKKMGHFIITGSQNLNLCSGISQSLAGRAALVELLPFSISEISKKTQTLDQILYKGFYPPLYDRKVEPHLWYEDYVKTYIERDVRQLGFIKDLSSFQRFLSLCAARSGQLLNYSNLSNAVGVDVRTIQSWISVLTNSYIIFLLKPHHKNFSKKIVKSPKLYFYDSGLLCWLLRLRKEDIPLSSHKGNIFESMIISEYMKYTKNRRAGFDFYFWRNNKGIEIDLLFQKKGKLFPVEIKSGQTLQNYFFKNLQTYQKYSGPHHGKSLLIYGGEEEQKRSLCHIRSWRSPITL